MKRDEHPYEVPVYEVARRRGVLPVAGVFFLAGRCHFAEYGSALARELVERGALHVATLRFDRDARERGHADRSVRALGAAEAVTRFGEARVGTSGRPSRLRGVRGPHDDGELEER